MSKTVKISLTIIVVGILIFGFGFALTGFDITDAVVMKKYDKKTMEIAEIPKNISIKDSDIKVIIGKSKDDMVHLTYFENENEHYDIDTNGDLVIKKKLLSWFDFDIVIYEGNHFLRLEIPEKYDGNMELKLNDCKVSVEDLTADSIELSVADGSATFEDVNVNGIMEAKCSCGRLDIKDVNVRKSANFRTADGKISLSDLDVKKSLEIKAADGKVVLDRISADESIDIRCSDGKVTGTIKGEQHDFTIHSKRSDGKCNLPEESIGGKKKLDVKTSDGKIELYFEK